MYINNKEEVDKIILEEIKNKFYYNKKNGKLFRKVKSANRINIGDEAGYLLKSGYRQLKFLGIKYYIHRLIWVYIYGSFPKFEIDHINRIKNDNRIENLRDVKHYINGRNFNIRKNNSSGFCGVTWNKPTKKWEVNIACYKGMSKYLGRYKNKSEAINVRRNAEKEYNYIV